MHPVLFRIVDWPVGTFVTLGDPLASRAAGCCMAISLAVLPGIVRRRGGA